MKILFSSPTQVGIDTWKTQSLELALVVVFCQFRGNSCVFWPNSRSWCFCAPFQASRPNKACACTHRFLYRCVNLLLLIQIATKKCSTFFNTAARKWLSFKMSLIRSYSVATTPFGGCRLLLSTPIYDNNRGSVCDPTCHGQKTEFTQFRRE